MHFDVHGHVGHNLLLVRKQGDGPIPETPFVVVDSGSREQLTIVQTMEHSSGTFGLAVEMNDGQLLPDAGVHLVVVEK